MKTLISTTEKYRRNNDRRRDARGYQSKRVESVRRMVELRRRGWSNRAIARELRCSDMTVARQLSSPLGIAIDSLT